jgi:hypothetical protein
MSANSVDELSGMAKRTLLIEPAEGKRGVLLMGFERFLLREMGWEA